MIELDHTLAGGLVERWPAPRVYAEAFARYAGYSGGADTGKKQWYWSGDLATSQRYNPSVHGSTVTVKFFEPRRMLGLHMVEPVRSGILCRMLGEPWDDDTLFALIAHLRPLPYSALVAHALIDQADWLDAHPGYRGLTIAQSTVKRYAPAALETA